MTDLLIIAEAQIAEKQVKEIEKIKERLDADKETIKQAIELVNSHTLYKKDGHRYVLATEEMLKKDYLSEPKNSWCDRGIKFLSYDSCANYNTGVLKVNGETYYDIRYALNAYEKNIKSKEANINELVRRMSDIKDELEMIKKDYPSLKEAIIEWQEYQKKMAEREE